MSAVEIHTEAEGAAASASAPESTSLDGTVSMSEVYEQMQHDARQAQAIAARSGAGLERCTYDDGYTTQTMYWCRSCHPAGSVGVCFGCSMNCHLGEDHKVEELFEKRAVRCDCGSARAGGCCALQPHKDDHNAANVYNHNYNGRYCRCDSEYDAARDVMLCCVLCQDWLHDRCLLGATAPDEPEEGAGTALDLLCAECLAMPKHAILLPYLDIAVRDAEAAAAQGQTSATSTPSMSRAVSVSGTPLSASRTNSLLRMESPPAPAASPAVSATAAAAAEECKEGTMQLQPSDAALIGAASFATPSRKRKADELSSGADTGAGTVAAAASPAMAASPSSTNGSAICQRPVPSPSDATSTAAADSLSTTASAAPAAVVPRDRFVPSDWNQLLCACPSCMAEYRQHGLLWLLDEEAPAAPAGEGGTAAAASSSGAPGSVLAPMSAADSSAPVGAAFDADHMVASYVERMPRGVAIDIITPFQLFQESIKRGLATFTERCPGQVVSGEVMQSIVAAAKAESQEQFQQLKRQRLEGQDALPE